MKIEFGNMKDNEDGSCNADVEYDEEALAMGTKWCVDHGFDTENADVIMQAYVIGMLEDYIKQEEEKNTDDNVEQCNGDNTCEISD